MIIESDSSSNLSMTCSPWHQLLFRERHHLGGFADCYFIDVIMRLTVNIARAY